MDDLVELSERPGSEEKYMIAGWRQWADAGSISSGLPQYLIERENARKIGEIRSKDFYLFQIPGTHHFLRPEIKLNEGYREELETKRNEFFYADEAGSGLVLFLGDEPHMNADRYAEAFLDAVEQLGVRRVGAVGGVYGAMPYDRERRISCVYSLREMKDDLDGYAVQFSNYEGGTTIGTYLIDAAERRGVEFFVFYAFVPAYDFSQLSKQAQGMRIENDYRAWYDVIRRFNHMFELGLDLSDLNERSEKIVSSMDVKVAELERDFPEVQVREYLAMVTEDFEEMPFLPLGEVWERELGDLFEDEE